MRQLLFAFLLGAVVGGFGSLVAVGPTPDTAPEAVPAETTPIVVRATPRVQRAPRPTLAADANDVSLAEALDQARFDGDWQRVTDVGGVLRRRGGAGKTASPARNSVLGGSAESSLVLVDHQYRHRAFRVELRGRDNAATQIAASDDEIPEKARRLRELFLAPIIEPGDAAVRADAAFLLAELRLESGRVALLRAIKDPDAALADLAAESLCRVDDPKAMEALQPLLKGDLDPTLRLRLVRAFGLSTATVAGGAPAETLADALRTDRDFEVRSAALQTLAKVDLEACPDALETIAALIEDEAEPIEVREACLAALLEHHKIAKSLPGQLVVALQRAAPKAIGPLRRQLLDLLRVVGHPESQD